MTTGHEDYLGDLWDLLPVDPTDFLEDTPTEDEAEKAPTSEWAFDHDADVDAHHTKFTIAEHDLAARHGLAVLDPLVCSEAEADTKISDHKDLPNDHHTKFTITEHDLAARHGLAVLDPLVCSEAEAAGLISDHKALPNDHHTKYTDAEARGAFNCIAISPCLFFPESDLYDWYINRQMCRNRATLNLQVFYAGVYLPNGCTITKLTLFGFRNDALSEMILALYRNETGLSEDRLALIVAGWTTGISSGSDTSIDDALIDNTTYNYSLYLHMNPNDSVSDCYLTGAVIEFTG